MPMPPKKSDFYDSEEGVMALRLLTKMSEDEGFNTQGSYSPNATLYPSNKMTFIEKHMVYLRDHPKVNPSQYVSNLKLMSRKR